MIQIDDFTAEFASAMQRAMALDQAILNAASKISPQYVDLVSLAARQTFSTIDITASFGSDGLANASDVRIFMKELGALTTYGYVCRCLHLAPGAHP